MERFKGDRISFCLLIYQASLVFITSKVLSHAEALYNWSITLSLSFIFTVWQGRNTDSGYRLAMFFSVTCNGIELKKPIYVQTFMSYPFECLQ